MVAAAETDVACNLLASLIPRDAGAVMEIGGAPGSAAGRFAAWNRDARFAAATLGDGGLAATAARYDCVTLAEDVFHFDHPVEVLHRAARLLAPGAPLLTVLPDFGAEAAQRLPAVLDEAGLTLDFARAVSAEDRRLIVRAVTKATPLQRMLIQHWALRPAGGVNDKRIYEPAAFLATIPGVQVVISHQSARQISMPPHVARVLVLQRRLVPRHEAPRIRETSRGYMVVSEFDDHPSHWPFIAANDHATFRTAHVVQTSTRVLAGELAPFTPEVAIFANQMAELPAEKRLSPEGPVTLFFGAFNRDAEWAPLMPVLQAAIARYGEALRFQVIHDRAFFDALPTAAKEFTDTCPYDRYLSVLGACDLALLPLSDTLFNRCKSDLKFIECAAHQVVALASPVVYANSIADGRTGLLFRSPQELAAKLHWLLDNPAQRLGIAARARDWVAANRLQAQHFRKRHDWYRSLIARKPALDAIFHRQLAALEAGHGTPD